jgi:predicted nucleic acid-binding protein
VAILDTTFFIDLFRRDAGATSLWNSIFAGDLDGAYSAVTVFELWVARLTGEEAAFYESILSLLDEVPLTSAIARHAAELLRNISSQSSERLIRDAMVAASAVTTGETLRTRNVRDFQRLSVNVETY